MIWRSRSLSARSSKSIALSVPGSSERAGAGAVTNRLDHALQALATALLNCATLFCSARHSGHCDLPRRVHPLPIEPFKQDGEFGCREPHDPVLDLGPAELALFQPLGDENYARAVPEDQLDPVSSFGPEHIDRARERVGAHRLTHERRETVCPFAEVDRLGRHHDADCAGGPNHGPTFSARITAAIACGLAPDPIRTTVPSTSTSIPMTGPGWRARRGCDAGGGGRPGTASTTAGTNRAGALGTRERRASRRQVNNCAGVSPCRRATPHTVLPGSPPGRVALSDDGRLLISG